MIVLFQNDTGVVLSFACAPTDISAPLSTSGYLGVTSPRGVVNNFPGTISGGYLNVSASGLLATLSGKRHLGVPAAWLTNSRTVTLEPVDIVINGAAL